ncbi:drug resistance transporter, EmrB/QacA subfamily [Desulfotomaculum arcticum]|uniref:Drug resistance transporter, EmrB/QacA subfamily n=1 Tax=Desulfotruncus arcticus DSM 17038 TaxID=1121424 RepID=A0A1I2P9P8_9FIRM|nr:MDR family MFS transporter [Desulfotruncus arcticus]SFG12220.1 drug resistance transporter, EmrB/QacA subfamily [Desulfotomaculum arcticum] [Desulfotruncus arcticus DSM 17038]
MTTDALKQQIQTTNQITGQRKWWALATVMVTMFFSSMDQTIISTAIPTIVGDLQGFALYAWVFSAYMLTSAVTVPIYGKLSDVYGRKPFYIFGLVMFGVGSAICGQAETMLELVLARGLQGIGAGAMMSMPRATVGDIFNPKERGRWMGAMGAVFGVSSIIGPAIGGWITGTFSWRWVFYINLPFAVLAIIGVVLSLPKVRADEQVKLDWLGSVLLATGLVPILLGFTWAGTKYAWTSPVELVLFGSGAIMLALFIWFERKVADPIITPTLFRNRIFSTSLVLGILVSMAMFGSVMFLPLFVQGVIGLNPRDSGLVMSPMMISFIVGSIISGQIMTKTGKYRLLSHISAAAIILGTILLMTMDINTAYPTVIVNMVVLGLGVGSLMPLLNIAVQNAFPYRMMGTVNSTQQFVSSLGGVIASPIFGSILNRGFQERFNAALPDKIKDLAGGISQFEPQTLLTQQAQQAIADQFARFGAAGQEMYHQLLHAVKVSLAAGIGNLFEVGLVFAVLCFIGTFFLPERTLQGDEYYND